MKNKLFKIATAIALFFSPQTNFARTGHDFSHACRFPFPVIGSFFVECECNPASAFTVDSVSPVTSLLCWEATQCPNSYMIGWRLQGSHYWINRVVFPPEHCTTFTNNYPAVYEIRLKVICTTGDTSGYSTIFTFQTYPSCLPPTNLYTDDIQATTATAHWSPVGDATKQNFWYRKVGNATWTTKNISATGTSYNIPNLLPSTSYEWKVRSTCSDSFRTVKGAFSAIQTFTTEAARLASLNNLPSAITLYPNPTHDGGFMIALSVNNPIDHATIEITNLVGQVIYQQEAMVNDGVLNNPVTFRTGIPAGTYFIRIIATELVYTTQLVYQP